MRIHLGLQLVLAATLLVAAVAGTAEDDEVDTSVPNYPHKFYSGFLDLGFFKEDVKHIHYVFFPSQGDISNDPLLLWFSGSPGCSGLLACFHEIGPFIFAPGKLNFNLNENSWNKKANLLFIDLPAGTGFSEGSNKTVTDESFPVDATAALRAFYARFPSYKKNDVYLTGHGYGATQIAYTAKLIIDENNDPYPIYTDKIKLKGILVGNACVRPDECFATGTGKYSEYHYEFLYKRGYFTKKAYNDYRAACLLNSDTYDCFTQRKKLDGIFNATNSSRYNIYDKCYKSKNTTIQYINTGCEDNAGILTYLNDNNTRKNWNVENATHEWAPCDDKVFEEYLGRNNSEWLYPFLIKNKLRIWVFSGDVDSFVPIVGTKRWIEDLRHTLEMPVKRIWREWWVPGRHKGEDQVGGFIWELRDITFVTVKNAGFRAAYDQPLAMTEVLNGFIAGKTLPFKNTA